MKIAVTYENDSVFKFFGQTKRFKVYEIEDNKVVNTSFLERTDEKHLTLATLLGKNNIDVLLCGGICVDAKATVVEQGIKYFGGIKGECDKAVGDYLAGKIVFDPDVICEHNGK